MRILLVEDNPDLGEAVENRLRKSGHSVEWVRDGLEAVEAAGHDAFDAVLLDIMLPGQDGFAVLRDLRRRGVDAPVLVVTARSEIDDKVGILDLGADDYLVKPFDLRELEARLRALLRRPAGQTSSTVSHGNVTLDLAGQAVTVAGQHVEFGRREFRLLEILLARAGQVAAKDRLMTQLFGDEADVSVNALELLVSRVRRKLEGADIDIVTLRGTGYRVQPRGHRE
ncbi:response regulator transcription factor [Inquilinus limosus]|uniref:DNA-binding response regulator n=1 Tax=Inquilinus limosus TaxID=171674 RepID=A0A211ZFP6_9PROT|nr:response regulator transcription factor [Inquilinus limosus]OWJ64016.1 DNA-binding response regulator [Inquilinus limosus]